MISHETVLFDDGHELHYSLSQGNIDNARATPLLICLHPGWEGELPPDQYGGEFLASLFLPAFREMAATIVSPTCPKGAWNNLESHNAILQLIDHLDNSLGVDRKRMSLVGMSAGGWGVWYMLQVDDDRFSSAILCATLPVIEPVDYFWDNIAKCDELLTNRVAEWVGNTPNIPIGIVHSRDDELLSFAKALQAHQSLNQSGRQVKFVAIERAGHFDVELYVEPLRGLVPWLKSTWDFE